MRGKKHSDDVRAAVMAALLAGQGVSEVAATYKIPVQTVSEWGKQIDFGQVRTKKENDFGDLLACYLETTLTTLREQVRLFGNREWLAKQSAADLAILHGVLADKAFRIFEAAERARQNQEGEADATEEA